MAERKSTEVGMSPHAPSTTTTVGPEKSGFEDDGVLRGFQANTSALPKGYYRSIPFIGIMFATGLGLACGVGGYAFAAPELASINADLGPDTQINWVSLAYTLTLAVSLLLVGRLSDLFGSVSPPLEKPGPYVNVACFLGDDGSSSAVLSSARSDASSRPRPRRSRA